MPSDDTARDTSLWSWFLSLFAFFNLTSSSDYTHMSEKGPKKNVVVVGGGHAGTLAARLISKKLNAAQYNLILITPRPFFVHIPAMTRMPVSAEDKLEDRALFGFDNLFYNKNGTVKIGKVTAIEEPAPGKGGEVVLEDGERIPYAALVLATGSSWPSYIELPNTSDQVSVHLSTWREKFKNAKHVVIVGGGAVGIELAGEIRYAYSDKKITLIHRDNMLINSVYPDKFRKDIERRLRVRNIDVILGDAIEDLTEVVSGVTTKNGKSIPDADLVVAAFGSRPNTEAIKSLGEGVLSPSGCVKVSEFLEVSGHPGVYAIGDIIDWKEQKQAAKVGEHAPTVAENLLGFLAGAPPKKPYKGSPELMMIPLGKSGGAGYMSFFGGITLGDFLTRMIKGKDLFIGMTRGHRGAQ